MKFNVPVKRLGFTLIELLIVVAIIGILAAIAVPNFLNAQIRAKIARTYSDLRMLDQQNTIRKTDINKWMVDGNDGTAVTDEICGMPWPYSFCGTAPTKLANGFSGFDNMFNCQIYAQLTTPIAYIGTPPVDPFQHGVYYGYETRDCPNKGGSHYILFAAGPDGDVGDWITDRKAKPYKSSNGLVSNGDVWLSKKLNGQYYNEEQIAYPWD